MQNDKIRNIAIIAHVDHGKTTLVDKLLEQGGMVRGNQEIAKCVMDSNDLEKERGITILAKNTSCFYHDTKINIVDTPGHADFGGEVERILKMVDGAILLVDSHEGAMPQTRFVLQKALSLGLEIIVAINKIDRPDERAGEVVDEVLELLIELGATDKQLDSPIIYTSSREGIAKYEMTDDSKDLTPLFETILKHIPAPKEDNESPLQLLVSAIDYNEYTGRIAIGKINKGILKQNQNVYIKNFLEPTKLQNARIQSIYQYDGLKKDNVEIAYSGDIVCVSGITEIGIGDTIVGETSINSLEFVKIDEPTMEMTFSVNDSPYAGRSGGKFLTSRQIGDRLFKETQKDMSLKVRKSEESESYRVAGRGEMHLSILIETMRREGYEFSVSMPQVIFKEIDGKKCEPYEKAVISVPEEALGSVMDKMASRGGEMQDMFPTDNRMELSYIIPSRGLFGYRNEFLTDTRGEGVLNTIFHEYAPYKGDEIAKKRFGSLIAFETGESITYGLFNAQGRGTLYIGAGVPVYEGMIIGQNTREDDIVVNVCKKKQLTNTRASGSDDALRLVPPKNLSLENAIELLGEDDLLEVTPTVFRLRKRMLNNSLRGKNRK